MSEHEHLDLQRQIEDLVALVTNNRVDIDALTERADRSQERADAAEVRADAAEARADQMEARSTLDRELIAELQADEEISREHVADLESALSSSRTVGAAIGILMVTRHIGQEEAFLVLKGASQRTNRQLRDLAQTIVAGVDTNK